MNRGWNRLARHAPWLLAAGVLLGLLAWVLTHGLAATGGHLSYALDDAFIHMATAKNVAQHGVWGVTRYEFSSACSSILWPLLLAAGYLVQVNDWLPLALNVVLALASLFVGFALMRRVGGERRPLLVAGVLVAMVAAAPMPAVIAGGMEHALQFLVALAFVGVAAAALARDEARPIAREWPLFALGAAMSAVRYEGLFFVFVAAVLLLARRRVATAVTLGVVAWLPVVVFGAYAMAQGSHFLPNSLLIKSQVDQAASLHGLWLLRGLLRHNVLAAPLVSLLLAGAGLAWAARLRARGAWSFSQAYLLLFAGGALMHLTLASVGWLFRYEAYLVVLGLVAFGLVAVETLEGAGRARPWRYAAVAVAALLLVQPAMPRAASLRILPVALADIYEQQVQMARFLGRYYTGRSVAANDIGAINFMNDLRCLDLFGLADFQVAMAKRANAYGTREIDQRTRDRRVEVAVIYDLWYQKDRAVPAHWKRVGTWTIQHHVVVGSPTVSFYAVDPSAEAGLVAALRGFASDLPKGVVQAGPYTERR